MEQRLQARAEHQQRGRRGWEGRVGHHDLAAKTWEGCQLAHLETSPLHRAAFSGSEQEAFKPI